MQMSCLNTALPIMKKNYLIKEIVCFRFCFVKNPLSTSLNVQYADRFKNSTRVFNVEYSDNSKNLTRVFLFCSYRQNILPNLKL